MELCCSRTFEICYVYERNSQCINEVPIHFKKASHGYEIQRLIFYSRLLTADTYREALEKLTHLAV